MAGSPILTRCQWRNKRLKDAGVAARRYLRILITLWLEIPVILTDQKTVHADYLRVVNMINI